jgi:hypothetical protein
MMALAKYIKNKLKLDAATSSIISAIRRYPVEEFRENLVDVADVLKDAKISTKTRITVLTIRRDFKALSQSLPQILKEIDPISGEVLRIVEGRESMKLLVDMKKAQAVVNIVGKENILDRKDDLAELNINLGIKKKESVKGVRATLLNLFATNNISVGETFSCLPEFIIYVNEKDIGKAHEILVKFCYGN